MLAELVNILLNMFSRPLDFNTVSIRFKLKFMFFTWQMVVIKNVTDE